MTDNQRKLDAYRQGNIEAATIIASDPVKYPPDSLLGQWAVMVLDQAVKTAIDTTVDAPAEIILADVAKYGGEEALVVVWARRVLERGDRLVAELKVRPGLEPAGPEQIGTCSTLLERQH